MFHGEHRIVPVVLFALCFVFTRFEAESSVKKVKK